MPKAVSVQQATFPQYEMMGHKTWSFMGHNEKLIFARKSARSVPHDLREKTWGTGPIPDLWSGKRGTLN